MKSKILVGIFLAMFYITQFTLSDRSEITENTENAKIRNYKITRLQSVIKNTQVCLSGL